MSKRRKFFSGPWTLVADPPPCDPDNTARALAQCRRTRFGQRCTCQFDLGAIAEDLEEFDLGDYADRFDDEMDAAELEDLTGELLELVEDRAQGDASRVQQELLWLRRLARAGSGVKPAD